jgi:hypothetical protein
MAKSREFNCARHLVHMSFCRLCEPITFAMTSLSCPTTFARIIKIVGHEQMWHFFHAGSLSIGLGLWHFLTAFVGPQQG